MVEPLGRIFRTKIRFHHVNVIENDRKTISIKKAAEIAKALKMPQKVYVQMAINVQIRKANLKFRVEVA